jgi:hypothetical protein
MPTVTKITFTHASRGGQLDLCGHCANQLWPALFAQGWAIWPIGEYALPSQAQLPEQGRGVAAGG